MKKTLLLFAAALMLGCLGCLTACNDDSDRYVICPSYYRPLIVTVRTLPEGDYYFERDNGETLYPSDKTHVTGYAPEDRRRVVITFDLLGTREGYDYDIALFSVTDLFCTAAEVVEDPSQLAPLGNAPTSLFPTECNLTSEWLTLCVAYPVRDDSKHTFRLIVNRLETPAEHTDGYLDVELHHDDGGDATDPDLGLGRMNYVSFDLTPIASLLKDMKGLSMRILTQQNGTKYVRFDLPVAE